MIIYYVLLLLLIVVGIRFTPPNLNNSLSRSCADAIKGIFILIVFSRHIGPYMWGMLPELSYVDRLYITIDGYIRQLLVVMFLFYSGYGVVESIRNKGKQYIDSIPHKRLAVTFINFAVAVCFFIVLALLLGHDISLRQSLLSIIGWESVGNSNWYIVCILLCYLFTYIAFKYCKSQGVALTLLGVFCLGYIIFMSFFKGGYWYDTIAAYWFGAWFSVYRHRFHDFIEKYYFVSLIVCGLLFAWFYYFPYRHFALADNVAAIFFAMIVVILTMRIQINSAPLRWLGKNLFPLYIYQRIPMILLAAIGEGYLIIHHKWIYVFGSLAITILITFLYRYFSYKPRRSS